MDYLRIYFDFMDGLFYFFTLEFFTSLNNPNYNINRKKSMRSIYLIFRLLYAIPETIPFSSTIIFTSDLLYTYIMSRKKIRTAISKFLKLEVYAILSTMIIFIIHSFFANDFYDINNNALYYNYKSLICSSLMYILLCLFVYSKRFLALRNKKHHGVLFCVATGLSVFVLSGLSLALLSGRFEISEALPIIFSLVFVVVTIILMSYNNIILSLEENAKQEILISKYELQSAYYQDMKKYMDSFRSLRHDFKNHLIILNTYAEQNDTEKLQNYLNKITDTLTDASVIQTPHDLISAILNTKALACREKKINFQQNCYFSDINISDYHLIKILGNILDNAITAAGKLENGFISFSMEQSDTYLHITCENNHKEKIIKKDGHFVTTKENANMFHGLGIKNIQSSIDELNGTLDIDYDDSMFTVSILIPNYY